jgi:hypothetical protein
MEAWDVADELERMEEKREADVEAEARRLVDEIGDRVLQGNVGSYSEAALRFHKLMAAVFAKAEAAGRLAYLAVTEASEECLGLGNSNPSMSEVSRI